MVEREVTIDNRLGLHARAAAKLVQLASRYGCTVELSRGDKTVNGKSIMGVMMLAAGMGTTVHLRCDGPQEQEALDAITELVRDRFGEGE